MFEDDPIKDIPAYFEKLQARYGHDLVTHMRPELMRQGLFRLCGFDSEQYFRFCWGADPLTAHPYSFRFRSGVGRGA